MDTLNPIVTDALNSWRVMLEAGISSAEALHTSGGTLGGRAGECFRQASDRTAKGEAIGRVLDAFEPILTSGERAMLAAGWKAGRIEATIVSLVRQRELWRSSRRRILGKLIKPAATLVIASFVAPLPLLFAENASVVVYAICVTVPLGFVFGLAFAAAWFFRSRAIARVFNADGTPVPASQADKLLLDLPLVGHVERDRSMAEFGELLSNLLAAGAPIVQALESTARAVRNGCFREEVMRLSNAAAKGHTLGAAMLEENAGLWPREFTAAVAVGERAGDLDATLARLAASARENYVRAIELFSEWLPRLVYGLVAIFVIFNIFRGVKIYLDMLNNAMSPGM